MSSIVSTRRGSGATRSTVSRDGGWLALTGTPGVGKTSIARLLRLRGWHVVDGKRFAVRHDAIVGVDRARRSRIVDPRRVGRALSRAFPVDGSWRVFEAHWAHEVPGVAAALVLRVRPHVLEARLATRRWPRAKIQENVEAEAMGIISAESRASFGRGACGELDATRLRPSVVARRVERILGRPRRELMKLEIGRINWTRDLLQWY